MVAPSLALITLALSGCGSGASPSTVRRGSQLVGRPFEKALVVVFENADYAKAVKDPNFAAFAARGAMLDNYYGVIHPSQGNYIAMTAGDAWGVSFDRNVTLDVSHIGDQLEAAGRSWKNYAEGYPGNCFLGATKGKYARKHVPFLSYRNVTSDPARCAKVVNADEFAKDVASGTLPDFAYYTPDLDNDGHDTGVAFGGRWLRDHILPLLDDPAFMQDRVVIVTFDEASFLSKNHIYTAVVGAGVAPGTRSAVRYDHYSLVRTLQEAWNLPGLGRKDDAATPIADIW
jgi:hypothetical protein